MVDETSEQKRLKDRVVLPLLIKHAAPFIDRVLALPMRNIRAAGAAMTAVTTRPGNRVGLREPPSAVRLRTESCSGAAPR